MTQRPSTRTLPARAGMWVASLAALLAAIPAHASFLQGDTLAKVANVMAIVSAGPIKPPASQVLRTFKTTTLSPACKVPEGSW